MTAIDIVDRLKFDAMRTELQFSKGVAGNIDEAAETIARLRQGAMATAYGNLMVRHHQAVRSGDEPLQLRIYAAIELFDELWPEEAAKAFMEVTQASSP